MSYEPRTYRNLHKNDDLHHFQVVVEETDLDIAVRKDRFSPEVYNRVKTFLYQERQVLKGYIKNNPVFQTTLKPYQAPAGAPSLVQEMCEKAHLAGVGPMAAVAGLFSQKVGELLTRYSADVIVENGGDIWLKTGRTRHVAIYAGDSPFSLRIGLEIRPKQTPLGICTSSGTVGHSLSFGRADAVIILAPSAALADAVATAAGNLVQDGDDLEKAVRFALTVPGVKGAVAIKGDRMAVLGEVKLAPL